ncbi:MAG TPA: acetylxylan esterase [Gemmataceae bacterium]|jgi:dienelactone hydrolase|nr:acetylxylan esterase [Gemmataceae bacterium]
MPSPVIRCRQCGYQFALDSHDLDEGRAPCRQCGATVPIRGVRPGSRSSKPSGGSYLYVWVIAGIVLAGLLAIGCCGGLIFFAFKSMQPTEFPDQTQDYADARKTFKTKLVKSGPAPQNNWVAEAPPPGVTEVTYTSGGLKLKAWINKPKPGEAPMPAVLYLHSGYAFETSHWDQCQPFRDAGFVTMTPLLRGENGQPGAFSFFYDEVDDAVAAAEMLAATPGVDPKHVFVAGHGTGGTLALLCAMTSKRFKGCASFSGSPDQVTFLRGQKHVVTFDQNDPNEFAMRSPLAYPKSFKCPVRLYIGDTDLPIAMSSQKLAEKAGAVGLNVQASEVEGDLESDVGPAMAEAIIFFKNLP